MRGLEGQSLTLWWLERRTGPGTREAEPQNVVPQALPPYLWAHFSVQQGTVQSSSSVEYRQAQTESVAVEHLGEHDLYRVRLRITVPRPASARVRAVRVSFELENLLSDRGEVLFQPAQFALMKGILASGQTGGAARVRSLQRVGARGFSAAVEIL
jgi:hypothetical protein